MRVYGVGPPRSGTTMLAKCLSVVRPVKHERARKVNKLFELICDAVVDDANDGTAFYYNGQYEVAWYLTFAKPADFTIYLKRPFEDWLDSMQARGYLDRGKAPWMLGSDDPGWVWDTYRKRAESLPQVYITSPADVVWEDLLDYLGWDATDDQIAEMYRIQATRPNKREVTV